jgi:hypothetical protein
MRGSGCDRRADVTKDYGTKPPPHGIRSRGHCERSEAIFARIQRLLRRVPLLLRNKMLVPEPTHRAARHSGRAERDPESRKKALDSRLRGNDGEGGSSRFCSIAERPRSGQLAMTASSPLLLCSSRVLSHGPKLESPIAQLIFCKGRPA